MSDFEDRARQWLKGLFGENNEKRLKFLRQFVVRANQLEPDIAKLSDEELKAKTPEFKNRIENALRGVEDHKLIPDDVPKMPGQVRNLKDKELAKCLEIILPEAFAVVRETGKRVLNMRHFDVQLLGGAALHFNKISEMRTGEGKTLVATLPAYLNGLTGRGVHVVTVNDYLARRDCEWMGQIYRFLGLSTGLIYSHQPDWEKSQAYQADIAYGTNHEFGFDYLRDNMRQSIDELVQRPYYFAIVDEVDNILIDEARTPLIISGFPTESFTELYLKMSQVAPMLERGKDKEDEDCDYWVDEKGRNVLLTEQGIINGERLVGVPDLYDMHYNYAHHLVQALRSKELYMLDRDYVVEPDEEGKPEVVIVDEFTGRKMKGRRWSDGLHQAVEAKERVPIQEETLTYASITYQNLFRLYPKLSGMTGTAMTESAEFQKIYNLDVVAVPTNRPSVRGDRSDIIFKTEAQKYYSVVEEILDLHEEGRPVLVGTVSIEKSEHIDDLLSKPQKMTEYQMRKIQKAVDLMKRNALEGPSIEAFKKILDRPGLIDSAKMELICKDIEAQFASKKQDEFIERCYSILKTAKCIEIIRKGINHSVLNAKHHEKEALIVAQAGRKGAVTVATNMAGRGTDILLGGNAEYLAKEKLRKDGITPDTDPEYEQKVKEATLLFKPDIDKEHDEVVKLGGLHIIGTERHEARRIDNQLRGRAGRQGDPGTTRFYLSLEDSLMRIFGGEKISRLMDFIRADEEMPIESGMVTKSIENAQKKVESHHFDMRKHVLQYDDVLNTQREVIYRERRRILERADLKANLLDMMEEHLDIILATHIDPDSPPELYEEAGLPEVLSTLVNDIPVLDDIKMEELKNLSYDDLRSKLLDGIKMAYDVREEHLSSAVMRDLERAILLRTIDGKWIDYLHNIDILREGIHLRGYGQRDPLQEYKREAFEMFNQLLRSIQSEAIQLLFRAQPVNQANSMMPTMEDLQAMLPEALRNVDLTQLTEEQFQDLLQQHAPGPPDDSHPVMHDGGVHFTASMPMMMAPPPQPADKNGAKNSQSKDKKDKDAAAKVSDTAAAKGSDAAKVSDTAAAKGSDAAKVSDTAAAKGSDAAKVSDTAAAEGSDAVKVSDAAAAKGSDAVKVSDAAAAEGSDAVKVSGAAPAEGSDAVKVSGAAPVGSDAVKVSGAPAAGSDALRVSEATAPKGSDDAVTKGTADNTTNGTGKSEGEEAKLAKGARKAKKETKADSDKSPTSEKKNPADLNSLGKIENDPLTRG